MKPGEVITQAGDIEINEGLENLQVEVANIGDRPIQVGSHYHFYETNSALSFEREQTLGWRLDIPTGKRMIYGFKAQVMGSCDGDLENHK
jgi:urease subunit beta